MNQLQRDVLELLRFSLSHGPEAAHLFFRMFRPEEIRALYDIPLRTRQRLWQNRADPEYQALFRDLAEPDLSGPGSTMQE